MLARQADMQGLAQPNAAFVPKERLRTPIPKPYVLTVLLAKLPVNLALLTAPYVRVGVSRNYPAKKAATCANQANLRPGARAAQFVPPDDSLTPAQRVFVLTVMRARIRSNKACPHAICARVAPIWMPLVSSQRSI